ncbi:MAG: ferritin family protein [Vallitaleaceae bacterium]|nr:ferritin family protein [Vallitaleaceae bacterium]
MNSLEFAIRMELDGEKYYKEQAEINKDNELSTVFLNLAQDEENHAKIMQNMFNELTYELKDNNTLDQSKSVFKGIGDFENKVWKLPRQIDLYREALEREKESIELYSKLLGLATDGHEKECFEYLVNQEEDHFAILEELILLASHPEEWVESAEFGIRKGY